MRFQESDDAGQGNGNRGQGHFPRDHWDHILPVPDTGLIFFCIPTLFLKEGTGEVDREK